MAIAFGMTIRLSILLPFIASLASACRPSDDASARTDSTSPRAGAPSPSALGGACSAVARVTRATLRIPTGRDLAASFTAPGKTPGTWQGCHFIAKGTVPTDSGVAARSTQLQAALLNDGWTPDPQWASSTPTTSEFGVQRVNALCVVSIGAADATAPQAAPAPAPGSTSYHLDIRCADKAQVRS